MLHRIASVRAHVGGTRENAWSVACATVQISLSDFCCLQNTNLLTRACAHAVKLSINRTQRFPHSRWPCEVNVWWFKSEGGGGPLSWIFIKLYLPEFFRTLWQFFLFFSLSDVCEKPSGITDGHVTLPVARDLARYIFGRYYSPHGRISKRLINI